MADCRGVSGKSGLERRAGRFGGVCAGGVDHLRLQFAAAHDLVDLLFEGHARKEIGDAIFDGEIRVAILGGLFLAHQGDECRER